MSDRRQEILNFHIDSHPTHGLSIEQERIAIDAMDEYMKECCLALLKFMAENKVDVDYNYPESEEVFYYKGEWITKEQLFENFL